MTENKQKICDLLLITLQATSNAEDVLSLTHDEESETVTVTFISGSKRVVNVAMDSGTAMIRDIIGQIT